MPRIRLIAALSLVSIVLLTSKPLHAQTETKGQRIFFSGHSFHVFMPGILADMASKGGIKDHTQLGVSSIGGSRVIQHWNVPQTTIAAESNDVVLPAETIHVASTKGFGAKGNVLIKTANGIASVNFTGKTDTSFTGCSGGKGKLAFKLATGNIVGNMAKEFLKEGKAEVFTMAPIYLPDEGIDNFVKLGVENNPKIRIFIQENWLPFDKYDPPYKDRPKTVDHNAPTAEELRKTHAPYFKSFDDHVAELNKKYNTNAVRVAPVGQAVIKLREAILAGKAPGLKEQNDLFTDAIGHAKAPLAAQVSYVYYALIYEKSPVGLPVPAILGKANDVEKLNRLLQEIAWDAVTSHPQSGVKK